MQHLFSHLVLQHPFVFKRKGALITPVKTLGEPERVAVNTRMMTEPHGAPFNATLQMGPVNLQGNHTGTNVAPSHHHAWLSNCFCSLDSETVFSSERVTSITTHLTQQSSYSSTVFIRLAVYSL